MISAGPELRQPPRIGVVIPYFQQQAGLLQRALRSVAGQRHRPVQVVVVDDGSPRAAAEEITAELRNALQGLAVVRQVNLGVAAARNAALDALADDVSAIAFLDSDDYWQPRHLEHAAAALSLGADFFFSNHTAEGAAADYFHMRPLVQRDILCGSEPIDATSGIVRWPDSVSALFGLGLPFQTSAVVFRRAVKPDLRFPTGFRRTCEDYAVFWELLTRSTQIMFCKEPTMTYGTGGVGIYQSAAFGSVAALVRSADELRWYGEMVNSRLLNPRDRRLMRARIAARRYEALISVLHLIRRRHNVLRELTYLLRSDPACAVSWCIDLPRILYRKLRAGSA